MADCDGLFESPKVAMGTIYGVRSFNVSSDGMLLPANMENYVWQPGENTAKCARYSTLLTSIPIHRPAERHCGCGFYAYYDGDNDYYRSGMVAGVIEAWGKIQVGNRGFRAEKAKIVALVVPYKIKKPFHKSVLCHPARWMARDRDREAYFGIGGGVAALVGLITAIVAGFLDWPWMLFPGIVLMWAGILSFTVASHSLQHHRVESIQDRIANLPNLYPDARIFKTEQEMRAAYPLHRPVQPNRGTKKTRFVGFDRSGVAQYEIYYD